MSDSHLTHEHVATRDGRLRCVLTGQELRRRDAVDLSSLRPELIERMRAEHPGLESEGVVSAQQVANYRTLMVEDMLHADKREITELEREVIDSLERHETVADNVEREMTEGRTFGQRAADKVAEFGGSWAFIICFFAVLVFWMALNVAMRAGAFDPYPFILLNLVLSCLAAVQAPIIMMSQRRSEAKDRARSLNDYQVNLKAELEIRHLHDKMDHLMSRQWERMSELQRIQIDLLQDAAGRKRRTPGG